MLLSDEKIRAIPGYCGFAKTAYATCDDCGTDCRMIAKDQFLAADKFLR